MDVPILTFDRLTRVVGVLQYRLSVVGFPPEDPWNNAEISALLAELKDGAPRASAEVPPGLRPHLEVEDFHTALVAARIESGFGLRIAHHLVGSTCDRCRKTLAESGPTPAGAVPSSDPLVLALRRVADGEAGRRAPTPMRRFLVERWREPLGFVRLVLEEALATKVDDPAETQGLVAVAGLRLLPIAWLQLSDQHFAELAGLTYVAVGEALRRSGRVREGLVYVSEAR